MSDQIIVTDSAGREHAISATVTQFLDRVTVARSKGEWLYVPADGNPSGGRLDPVHVVSIKPDVVREVVLDPAGL